jgi:hypothetical protein
MNRSGQAWLPSARRRASLDPVRWNNFGPSLLHVGPKSHFLELLFLTLCSTEVPQAAFDLGVSPLRASNRPVRCNIARGEPYPTARRLEAHRRNGASLYCSEQ